MPFDFHNRDRIDHLLEEIEELRYKDRRDLSGFCSRLPMVPSSSQKQKT